MYDAFVADAKTAYAEDKIATGSFGAMMSVALVNDGPVTLALDSRNKENRDPPTAPSTPAAAASSQ